MLSRSNFAQRLAAGFVVFGLLMGPGVAGAVINAVSADDICEPSEDPCVITEKVNVLLDDEDVLAVLDFGLRTVQTIGGGNFDFGGNSGELSAGRWLLGGSGNSIAAKANGFGGFIVVTARGTCSDDAERACLLDIDCEDEEATCSGGDGRLDVTARINVSAGEAGGIELRAAGDLTVSATLDAVGTATESDGGDIDLESGGGTVNIAGVLSTDSGGQGTGGDVTVAAGGDVLIQTAMSLTGGDGDGGSLLIEAGNDVVITANIDANAGSGAGSGGFIDILAGRDIVMTGPGASSPVKIFSDGNRDSDDFAGDGGDHSYFAGRDIVINEFVILTSSGARPDGFGGEVSFDASRDVVIGGDVVASGKGSLGEGGTIDLFAAETLEVLGTANFDTTAGDGAGTIEAASVGPMVFGGAHDLRALASSGFGGDAFLSSDDTITISGEFLTNGDSSVLFASACRMDVSSTGFLNNVSLDGIIELEVRESMQISAGGRLDASDGVINLAYRDAAKPPVILGVLSPDPELIVRAELRGCPVCGNGELDEGESCEDGNTANGDGCGEFCQLDACVEATPGFPEVPICDDGKECTIDTCDSGIGQCLHVVNCDDGVACTSDRCVGEFCVNTPVDSRCDDGVFCNGAETCLANAGCAFGPAPVCDDFVSCTIDTCDLDLDACAFEPDDSVCDDGVFCNGPEVCSTSNGCEGVEAVDCSDDFDCTDDSCDEVNDRCLNAPFDDRCPGGLCSDGVCNPVLGCRKEDNGLCSTTTTSSLPIDLICGDADLNGFVRASDALLTLQTAVGAGECDPRVCDFDGDGNVRAGDALDILRLAVGLEVTPECNFSVGVSAVIRYQTTSTSTTSTAPGATTTTLPN